MARILVVDDERAIAALAAEELARAGHETFVAHDGDAALLAFDAHKPDLLVLDVMLPKKSGTTVCAAIRARPKPQPVILMLTAKTDEADAVIGYDVGADDYVRKPFSVRELVRRVQALLRLAEGTRAQDTLEASVSVDHLSIDIARHAVDVAGTDVSLAPMEFDLLVYLLRRRGVACSREQLLHDVWHYNHAGSARTVDSHVTRVRRKLAAAGLKWESIVTVHGIGYRFDGPG